MGYINDKREFTEYDTQKSNPQSGKPGIGFKLDSDGNYDMQHKKITNLANPTKIQDSVNYMTMKAQTLLLDGTNHMTGSLNMNGKDIINSGNIIMQNKLIKQMGNPVGDQDGVNLLTLNKVKQELQASNNNKLSKNIDIDMSGHKIFGLENNPDHKIDDEYSQIVRDVKPAVNKEYINAKCLKVNDDETYFDLKGKMIKNSEPFNSIYDDQSLVPKKYIDQSVKNVVKFDPSGDINLKGKSFINGLRDPDRETDAVNVRSVRFVLSGRRRDIEKLKDIIDMNDHKIINLEEPTEDNDASTKKYIDGELDKKLDITGGDMTGSLNMGNNRIKGISTPLINTDASNKFYVDVSNATNKKYIDDEIRNVNNGIILSGETNVFEYIMDDLSLWKAEEFTKNLIFVEKDLGVMTYNHKVLQFDIKKRERPGISGSYEYYGMISFDCLDLSHGAYTFIIYWYNTWVRDDNVLTVESTSLNINNNTLINHGMDAGYNVKPAKYNEFVIQTTKYSNSGLIQLFFTYVPPSELTVSEYMTNYLILYGVEGTKDTIDKKIYDSLFYYENKKIRFAEDIYMNDNRITNVKIDNDNCVVDLSTVKQYYNLTSAAIASAYVIENGNIVMKTDLDMSTHKILNYAPPSLRRRHVINVKWSSTTHHLESSGFSWGEHIFLPFQFRIKKLIYRRIYGSSDTTTGYIRILGAENRAYKITFGPQYANHLDIDHASAGTDDLSYVIINVNVSIMPLSSFYPNDLFLTLLVEEV